MSGGRKILLEKHYNKIVEKFAEVAWPLASTEHLENELIKQCHEKDVLYRSIQSELAKRKDKK